MVYMQEEYHYDKTLFQKRLKECKNDLHNNFYFIFKALPIQQLHLDIVHLHADGKIKVKSFVSFNFNIFCLL